MAGEPQKSSIWDSSKLSSQLILFMNNHTHNSEESCEQRRAALMPTPVPKRTRIISSSQDKSEWLAANDPGVAPFVNG